MTRRRVFAAVFALLAVSVVTGCASNDSLAQQYRDGNEKGYIAGDFQVVQILESDRGEPVAFEGLTETGESALLRALEPPSPTPTRGARVLPLRPRRSSSARPSPDS